MCFGVVGGFFLCIIVCDCVGDVSEMCSVGWRVSGRVERERAGSTRETRESNMMCGCLD